MRFKFCGDLDCPDWILGHIAILSKMTSIKMKLLVGQVVQSLLTSAENKNDLDMEKVMNIASTSKLTDEEIRSCVACLEAIITSAAKYDTSNDVLSNELQQLGLPKEHSSSLSKVYSENLTKLQESLKNKSLRTSRLKEVTSSQVKTKLSGGGLSADIPSAQLSFHITRSDNIDRVDKLNVTQDSLSYLIGELEGCRDIMSSLK